MMMTSDVVVLSAVIFYEVLVVMLGSIIPMFKNHFHGGGGSIRDGGYNRMT